MYLLLVWTALCSCISPTEKYPSQLKDRATLKFSHEGKEYTGIGVISRKSWYKIKFKLPENTKELVIKTCHREEFINTARLGFVTYSYVPVYFLENWDSCLMVASAHTSDGKRQFALIDFTSNETLDTTLYCNGKKMSGKATFCQAREGTQQMIVFKKPVKVKSISCELPTGEHGENFTSRHYFTAQKGYCIYAFYDNKDVHRLTVYGY